MSLAAGGRAAHSEVMFSVTEAQAATIRATFEKDGELSAAIEVRRLFPGVTNNQQARSCACTIAGWTARAAVPPRSNSEKVVKLRPAHLNHVRTDE